jgi:hypothetical protein
VLALESHIQVTEHVRLGLDVILKQQEEQAAKPALGRAEVTVRDVHIAALDTWTWRVWHS